MHIAAVKEKNTNLVEIQEILLDKRVEILALGILSSAIVLIAVQPPASFFIAAVIVVVTFAAVLPSNIHPAKYVDLEPFSPRWNRTKEYVEISFPTIMEWRSAKPIPTLAIPREPVGRKEPFISAQIPTQSQKQQRVPVGERIERHGDRVPVGIR